MTINSHVTTFAGLPVVAFDPEGELPDDPAAVAWRVETEDFEAPPEEFAGLIEALITRVPEGQIRALVLGEWGSTYEVGPPIELLISLAPRLSGLRAIFVGDLTYEQCEISWIHQGEITPLLTAYPELEVLRIRGAEGLVFEAAQHASLRELGFESGGLPAQVVRAVGASDLPALQSLDLWLGTSNYGADSTVDDLAPILSGERLPSLRSLALCNAEIADAVAAAVATAPVIARLDVLDLSKGELTDEGLDALLAGQPLTHLSRLDLHHHYLSAEGQERLTAALPGVEIDLSEPRESDESDGRVFRYVSVGE
ncbi:STM4015 family protein [Actinoplanes friuliensis]|uniref:Monocyte differentiation antigen CD14 n=1 Tax=Actinoplanes friuliensis DSM 7358 TaxID=1246995 RepID=U5VQC2_9ACTN|nr:STM4015 family protein [Actinoplanes friuliensis]AGZ39012.1 Monocyte differentiation antigen CD14 [Actinoplanes friuliensis DSM 7358]